MGSFIANQWQYNTVMILNGDQERATGFMVALETQTLEQGGGGKVFLVTTKHSIHSTIEGRENEVSIRAVFYSRGANGTITPVIRVIPLKDAAGANRWWGHADENVDVCVIDVSETLESIQNRVSAWIDLPRLTTARFRQVYDVCWGDDVFVIGYPEGLSKHTANLPLIKDGVIASHIGTPLRCQLPLPDNEEEFTAELELPAFFVDASVIEGMSGSVVVLKPIVGRYRGDHFDLGPAEPCVLGIFSHVQLGYRLGFVWDADAILQTLMLYFAGTEWTYGRLVHLYYANRPQILAPFESLD